MYCSCSSHSDVRARLTIAFSIFCSYLIDSIVADPFAARVHELCDEHHTPLAPRRFGLRSLQRLRAVSEAARPATTHLAQD